MLCGLGLLASFFHLGRPERAWRAAAMWRTSWLSREVIALPVFMGRLFALGRGACAGLRAGRCRWACWPRWPALALFVCTGMVYASIRFLQEWASPLTLVNYTLLGLASGCTLATALAGVRRAGAGARLRRLARWSSRWPGWSAAALSLARNARLKPTLHAADRPSASATRSIVQTSMGFMGGSFNTREFFHGQHARRAAPGEVGLPAAAPSCCRWCCWRWACPSASAALLALAFVVQYAGLLAERWFFLAQANHPQNLYYQAVS